MRSKLGSYCFDIDRSVYDIPRLLRRRDFKSLDRLILSFDYDLSCIKRIVRNAKYYAKRKGLDVRCSN